MTQTKQNIVPAGWKETTLGGVVDTIVDNRGRNPDSYSISGIPIIDNVLITGERRIDLDQVRRFIDENTYSSFIRKYNQEGDVLITLVGNGYGNIALSPKQRSVIIQNTIGLRCNDISNNGFIFYYLSLNKKLITDLNIGAAQPSVKVGDLLSINILLPPPPEQKAIAAILSSLDDKIELLRQENKTHETIAQTIFKEWFINFEFPNEKGKPYKSSGGKMIDSELREIPEGWRVGTVNDVIERFSITYRCDKDDLDVQGKMPIIDQGSNGLYGYTKRGPDFLASRGNPVVVFANHTCNMWFINYPFCAIQNIIPFRGNAEYSTFFVFHMTLGQISFIEYKGHWPDFEQKEYVIPRPDVANRFAEIVKPLQYKIWNNNSQIQTLSKLRDTLLPKLMKGEVRVKGFND
jgi:type I restriction enzyme S subunit